MEMRHKCLFQLRDCSNTRLRGKRRSAKSLGRCVLEQLGLQVELLVHTAESVEHHGFDGMACGHNTQLRIVLGCLLNDLSDVEFFEHAGHDAGGDASIQPQTVHSAIVTVLRRVSLRRRSDY
jgi:hypothetical protein